MADSYIKFERQLSSPNEVFSPGGDAFPHYGPVLDGLGRAHRRMLERQRELGIYGEDKTHPADYVSRVVPAADWEILERGLAQSLLDFSTHVLCEISGADREIILHDPHADYRIHALAPDAQTVEVVPGVVTRVVAPGSKLVNISSGGKMKDTRVLG